MRYTLVPVPKEHVLDVMRWVLFHAPDEEGEGTGRNQARVIQLLDALDDFKRALLVLVAKSVATDDSLTLRRAAEKLGTPSREVSDSLRKINQQAVWGRDVVTLREETVVGVLGKTGKIKYVTMRPDIARLVRAAARSASASGE